MLHKNWRRQWQGSSSGSDGSSGGGGESGECQIKQNNVL